MCVTGDNSKDAITHFRVLKRYDKVTLLECRLETGRTHQIRVHMNYINHPVVNDPVYGLVKMDDKVIREHTNNKEEYEKYKGFGQLLHAKCIGFVHPVTHEYMEFERDVPEEFIKIEKMFSL